MNVKLNVRSPGCLWELVPILFLGHFHVNTQHECVAPRMPASASEAAQKRLGSESRLLLYAVNCRVVTAFMET